MSRRFEVLAVYRRILRTARTWQASSGLSEDTNEERLYIETEARHLFRKNKDITDPKDVALCIREAEARLDMAFHYQNPYPRPVNLPPLAVPQSQNKIAQTRRLRESRPVYVHSQ